MKGFNRLVHTHWEKTQQDRINKLFSGDEKDWTKKSLSVVRQAAKEDLLEKQKYRCAYCRREIVDEIGKVELDHVIPKSFLPIFTYHRLNLVATCKRCNHRKREFNPLAVKSKRLVNYPISDLAYIWVHPYFHKYSKCIKSDGNGFYQAVNGSPEGLAVITNCALSSMHFVVAQRKRAIVKSTATFEEALLQLLYEFPKRPSLELAHILQIKTSKKVPISFLVTQVEEYRKANYAAAKRIRTIAAGSPYAKHLK